MSSSPRSRSRHRPCTLRLSENDAYYRCRPIRSRSSTRLTWSRPFRPCGTPSGGRSRGPRSRDARTTPDMTRSSYDLSTSRCLWHFYYRRFFFSWTKTQALVDGSFQTQVRSGGSCIGYRGGSGRTLLRRRPLGHRGPVSPPSRPSRRGRLSPGPDGSTTLSPRPLPLSSSFCFVL